MAGFRDCIEQLIGRTKNPVSKRRARELIDQFDDLMEDTGRWEEATAAREVLNGAQFRVYQKMRHVEINRRLTPENREKAKGYTNAHGQTDTAAGVRALVSYDQFSGYSSVESRYGSVLAQAHHMMSGILALGRRTITGGERNKANMRNLVHELFGRSTGDRSAKEMAEAWIKVSEYLRKRANRGGMSIDQRQDWGMPQTHNVVLMRRMGKDQWVRFTRERIDEDKFRARQTGTRLPFDDIGRELEDVYDTIITGGLNDATPGGSPGSRSLASRRQDHRYLPFKDSQNWLEYQERFGEGDPFSVMTSHVDAMSRDIARLEILGPNDRSMMRFLRDTAEQDAANKTEKRKSTLFTVRQWKEYTAKVLEQTDNIMNLFTGTTNTTAGGTVARTFAGLRNIHLSATLGSTAITALTDFGFANFTARMAGLPQVKLLTRTLDQILSLNHAERIRIATRLGLIADHAMNVGSAQMRYVGAVEGNEITRRVADGVLRISGLSHLTQMNRWGFGMTVLGGLGDMTPLKFADLNPKTRGFMQRYGIGADDWDIIRSTDLYDAAVDVDGWASGAGTRFLSVENLAKRSDISAGRKEQTINKLLEMIQGETRFAVPSVSLRSREFFITSTTPGTVAGEVMRSTAMYTSFFLEMYNTHLQRILRNPSIMGRTWMGVQLAVPSSLIGAFVLQMQEIIKGRDPRNMDARFFVDAAVQGGFSGPFGDVLVQDLIRAGNFVGVGKRIGGPIAELGDDVLRLTLGNVYEAAQGEKTNFSSEALRFTQRNMPGGSLWYARLAYERGLDQALTYFEPIEGRRILSRKANRFRNERGQEYWWRPGTTAPQRTPELTE